MEDFSSVGLPEGLGSSWFCQHFSQVWIDWCVVGPLLSLRARAGEEKVHADLLM